VRLERIAPLPGLACLDRAGACRQATWNSAPFGRSQLASPWRPSQGRPARRMTPNAARQAPRIFRSGGGTLRLAQLAAVATGPRREGRRATIFFDWGSARMLGGALQQPCGGWAERPAALISSARVASEASVQIARAVLPQGRSSGHPGKVRKRGNQHWGSGRVGRPSSRARRMYSANGGRGSPPMSALRSRGSRDAPAAEGA